MNIYTVIAKWNDDVKGMNGATVKFTYTNAIDMIQQGIAILKDPDLRLIEFRTAIGGKMWREME